MTFWILVRVPAGAQRARRVGCVERGLQFEKVGWVLDCDMRSFFDRMSHEWTLEFVQRRIGDPRLLRLIQKWLKAGVSEEGQWSETTVGTPQGR